MNIIMLPLNQSSRKCESQRYHFCASVGFLALLVFLISVTVVAEEGVKPPATNTVETQITESTGQKADTTENTDTTSEMQQEKITGTSDRMERDDRVGITILIGNAKTVRYNEQDVEIGFLNADKITMKSDPETGTTTEIIAEGNVEIRDQDIFATCDHAIMNNLTNIITLKENVVVLQNKDRLETKLFTFNRTTGKQTGEGGVKFKVSVTQAVPVTTETDENPESGEVSTETDGNSESGEAAADGKTPVTPPDKTEESKKDTDAGADVEEKSDADTEKAEDADSEEETDTDAEENADDTDADPEADESEND